MWEMIKDGDKSKCWLDLSGVVRGINVNGKECNDWKNSIGCKIGVRYKWRNDEIEERLFEIIDYDTKTQKLTLKQNNNMYKIKTNDLQQGKFGNIFDKVTSKFKYEIGQTINGLILIDIYYKKNKEGQQEKWYKYQCEKGHVHEIVEKSLKKGTRCSICTNQTVLVGYNDLATTDSHLVSYFKNPDDAKKYTAHSHKKVTLKCPYCGKEKEMRIDTLINYGFSCPNCSDGVSIPEKYMSNILHSVNYNYAHQLSKVDFEWIGKYKYDFYLPDYNIIIETHGEQHYKEKNESSNWDGLENVQKNDNNKLKLAEQNGYELNKNYFVIDCSSSDFKILTENIKHTLNIIEELYDIDFSTIDYKECYIKSQISIFNLVVEIANEHPEFTQQQIADELKEKYGYQLTVSTISSYLKKSNKLGLTNYKNKNDENKKAVIGINIKNQRIIIRYESITQVKKDGFTCSAVCGCVKGRYKSHKGYYWCYEEDYEKFMTELLES